MKKEVRWGLWSLLCALEGGGILWLVLVLSGCTPNFWNLRTGVLGGETEGDVEALVDVDEVEVELDALGGQVVGGLLAEEPAGEDHQREHDHLQHPLDHRGVAVQGYPLLLGRDER